MIPFLCLKSFDLDILLPQYVKKGGGAGVKYGFYISGKSERLKKYLFNCVDAAITDIAVIVSEYEFEPELKELFLKYKIKHVVYQYKELGVENEERRINFSNLLLKELEESTCDYCFSFGSHILAGELLLKFKYRIINFHPALLPMFPGKSAIDQAVESNRCLIVGNSAHFIDEGVDSGPLIMQSVIPIKSFLDTNDYNVILDLQINMLEQLIMLLKRDEITIENNQVLIKSADYTWNCIFPKINCAEGNNDE